MHCIISLPLYLNIELPSRSSYNLILWNLLRVQFLGELSHTRKWWYNHKSKGCLATPRQCSGGLRLSQLTAAKAHKIKTQYWQNLYQDLLNRWNSFLHYEIFYNTKVKAKSVTLSFLKFKHIRTQAALFRQGWIDWIGLIQGRNKIICRENAC